MIKKSDIKLFVIYGLIVFAGMFLFLTVINPLEIYDVDDWLYIYELRKPIPMISAWNPTKVFPETFMPFVSYFGAWVINPIINDYYYSLTLAHGLFASILLTIYFVQFALLFYKRNFASAKASIGFGSLFILLHFISHILKGSDNSFLLGTINVTCFYNYTLAVIMNAILVMHFMSYGGTKAWLKATNRLHKFIVLVWIYFSINSNLYSSVVLAAYIGTDLLLELIGNVKEKKFELKTYFVNNWFNLFIIFCWLFSNVLETFGGRAADMHKSAIVNLPITIVYAIIGVLGKNIFITILDLVVFISWFRLHDKKINTTAKRFLLYYGLGILYLIMLSATVEPYYIFKAEVQIGYFFYSFMGMIACLCELIKANRKFIYAPLILLGTIGCLFIKPGRILIPYNFSELSYDQCEAVMEDLIDQVQSAEAQGQDEMVLVIPKFDDETNWPFCDFIGDRVVEALYRHKVIDSRITVTNVIFSEEKNKEFGIPSSK